WRPQPPMSEPEPTAAEHRPPTSEPWAAAAAAPAAPPGPEQHGDEDERWTSLGAWGDSGDDRADDRLPDSRNETGMTRRERRLQEGDTGSNMGRLIGMGIAGLVVIGLVVYGAVWLFSGDESTDL